MKKKPVVLVSSTVYGIEELLERVYTLLTQFGYEVWMSHKGTVPVFSNKSAFENCIEAVEKCDLFLGVITPSYGSGRGEGDELSITHKELKEAIRLNKPRWLLSHDHVVFARSFLKVLGFDSKKKRDELNLAKNNVFSDLKIIDMYEDATMESEKNVSERKGNWVQKFQSDDDALLFTSAQFSRFQEVEEFIKENFKNLKGGKI
ncbi:MAG: DUF4062 domain-containing protein [Candidatus Delongbacteria bacterium]